MEPRRIADLVQLSEPDFLEQVSNGLNLVHENSLRIWESVPVLAEKEQFRSAEILKGVALEEAAKYLILLDAVRCPPRPEKRLTRQLKKFSSHLARGIYAYVCDWRPADFAEVRKGVEDDCKAYYLDGPNGADWIFRNDMEREREEALYVDYVQYDRAHEWVSPRCGEEIAAKFFFGEPPIIGLIRDLHVCGFSAADALNLIAEIWRPRPVTDATHFVECRDLIIETLQAMSDAGILMSRESESHANIADHWPFPLYDLPMIRIDVSKEVLREIQRNWHPPD